LNGAERALLRHAPSKDRDPIALSDRDKGRAKFGSD
jgi:hypothetical protein